MDYKHLLIKVYEVSVNKIESLNKENINLKKQLEEFEEHSRKLEEDKFTLINYFKKEMERLKEEVEDIKYVRAKDDIGQDEEVGETTIDLQEFIDAQKEVVNTNKKKKISIILEIVLILMITLLLILQIVVFL